MRAVFLVPRRNDNGHRDRLWDWCRRRWETYFPDIAIYEGHDTDGLFNRAAAVNRAAEMADRDGAWDVGIIIDSDVFLKVSQVREAVSRAHATGKVVWAHRRWREFHEDWTKRTLDDRTDFGAELDSEDLDILVQRTNPISWSCCIAVPRKVWDDIGGMDERFEGWGFEDMAFQSLIVGLYGYDRIEGDVLNLWHPRSPERIIKGQPRSTASQAYITNARLGRRYMFAARRDHKVHDRPQPADEDERQRDMKNLVNDDAKWSVEARRQGLPNWDDWWPTLEELRDGAKAHRFKTVPNPTVTLVMHSGGEAATWQDRKAYLLRSMESLTEQVTGPIVQRVVYSDWGVAINRELEELVKPFGFYVAGPDQHVGFTGNMQAMWRYLNKRAIGSHIFQVEDDFLYTRPVDLSEMVKTLTPDIAQVVLLRGAYYARETESDGILGWPRDKFEAVGQNGTSLLVHSLFWSQNPSLYRKDITDIPWPRAASSERVFGDQLIRRGKRFAFLGTGEPWIEHIGEVRAGTAY